MKINKSKLKEIIKQEILDLIEAKVIQFPGGRVTSTPRTDDGGAEIVNIADRFKKSQYSKDDLTMMDEPVDWQEVENTINQIMSLPGVWDAFDGLGIDADNLSKALWLPLIREFTERAQSAANMDPESAESFLYRTTLEILVDIGAVSREMVEQLPVAALESLAGFMETTPEKLVSGLLKKGYIEDPDSFTVDQIDRAGRGVMTTAREQLTFKQRYNDPGRKNLKRQMRIVLGLEKPSKKNSPIEKMINSKLFKNASEKDKKIAKRKLLAQSKKGFFEEGAWDALELAFREAERSPLSVRLAKAAKMDYLDWMDEVGELWNDLFF